MNSQKHDFPQPIFVGGSARSGSHAVGRLLEADPRYHLVEVEARFHCAHGGLTELIEGKTDLDSFCELTLTEWWRRGLRHNRGLMTIIERDALERALEQFQSEYAQDKWEAARRLVHAIMDPGAQKAGKPAWVDVSGGNIRAAPTLAKLFPQARFIHLVRDGRAVTAALLRKRLGTDDRAHAFRHWVKRVHNAHETISQIPRHAITTIMLENLTAFDRDASFQKLADLLELDDPRPMREYFDSEISAKRAHVGAWRERIAPADARWVDRRYKRAIRRMNREGIDWVPDPKEQ
jgi:hypothetical protein